MGCSTGSLWKSRQSCGIFDVLTSVFVQRSVRADLQSNSRRNDSCRWFLFKVYTLLQPLRGLRCLLTQFTWFTFDTLDSEERHPCGAHGMGLVQPDERSSGRHWVEMRSRYVEIETRVILDSLDTRQRKELQLLELHLRVLLVVPHQLPEVEFQSERGIVEPWGASFVSMNIDIYICTYVYIQLYFYIY